jgi:diguanylate cyclase (GGDEF)-like protein/PAS domain S-box-containing protein
VGTSADDFQELDLLSVLMHHSPDIIFFKRADGRYIRTNFADAALLGFDDPAQVVGKTDFDLFPPQSACTIRENDLRVMSSRSPMVEPDVSFIAADGSTHWLSTTKVPIVNQAGQVTGIFGISRDITARKLAEETNLRAEQRYRELFDGAPVMYVVTEECDGVPVVAGCNALFLHSVGYAREHVVGHPFLDFLAPASRIEFPVFFARAMNGEPTEVERQLLTRDGRIVDVLVRARPRESADGSVRGTHAVMVDVTEQRRAEAALRKSEELLQMALAATATAAWSLDTSARHLDGTNVEALFGRPPGTFDGRIETSWQSVHTDDLPRLRAIDAGSSNGGGDYDVEYRVIWPDGSLHWLAERARVVERNNNGNPWRYLGVTMDVTERKSVEEALRASEEQFRLLFAANPHPMWVYDRETLRFLEVNGAAIAHYGYTRDEFLAMTIEEIRPSDDLARLRANLARERPELEASSGWRHLTRDGRILDVEITSHAITFRGRQAVLVVAQDVTARLVLERQLAHQAFHDPLTGLPNRLLFRDRLEHALARRAEHAGSIAVLFLDLDEFKVVNDTLGHEAGDRLLVAVADRLRRCLREHDTLARLGGDEFTVLLEDLPDPKMAGVLAERVTEILRTPFHLDDREIVVTASVGIAVPTIGAHADEVLRLADVAMYEAKHRGRDRVAVFDVGMDARAWRRLGLEADLRRALAGEQLRVHYQPLVALAGSRISGVEALVRWEHPNGGLVQPGEFIPLAEETGLIVPLGRWVLVESCRQVAAWQREFPTDPPLDLSVNLSARQFQHPALIDDVARALAESGLPATSLTLEVTETTALEDVAGAMAALQTLKELGVRLAIDDFGAGYAGLGYLRRCPVDRLKIDRSYVAGLGFNQADMAMVRAVVEFASVLGIEVTAEGIETAAQLATVRSLGCHQGQGFYFSRPIPAEAMTGLLTGAMKELVASR